MLVAHGKFMRSNIGTIVGPMPLDNSANPGLLTAGEVKSISPFLRSRALGGEDANGIIRDDEGNIIGADPDNPAVKAQLAKQGGSSSSSSGGLSNAQLQQLGSALGTGLSNVFAPKPPPPPAPTSVIPGVPNIALALAAVALVIAIALKA